MPLTEIPPVLDPKNDGLQTTDFDRAEEMSIWRLQPGSNSVLNQYATLGIAEAMHWAASGATQP